MVDDSPDRDPEIRRRAAWLLGMLALVAALFVALMVTFFNTSGGGSNTSNIAEPTDVPTSSAASTSGSSTPRASTSSTGTGQPSSPDPNSQSPTDSGSATGGTGGTASCPSKDPCGLDSDIGNAIAAINAYRTDNGKSAVPGSVSKAATRCALSNGSDCSGGWAQTQVPAEHGKANGKAAVEKIKSLGKLLGDMKSIEVGWAYDPGAKTFYFAIVRNT